MASLEALLAGPNVSKMVESVKSGLPLRVPESFMRPTDPDYSGHTFEWYETDGNRDLATIVSQGSPARRVGHQTMRKKSATMLRTFESQQFEAHKLRNLTDPMTPEKVRDEKGAQFVRRNAEWFKKRQENQLMTSIQSMLLRFSIHYDQNGDILTSSSGATVSVDPAIPAGQLTTLDILGSGAILGASWATAGTDIMGDMFDIRDQMMQLGGWEMKHVFHGGNVPKYIGANDVAKNYINNTPALATQRYAGGNIVPNGFCGYEWHDCSNAYYIDSGGTVRKFLTGDEIVVTPDPSDEWWRLAFGSEMVPNGTAQVGGSIDSALDGLTEVFGNFGYAAVSHNPTSVEIFSGLNWLPVIVATKAVCRGTTV